MYRSLFTLFVIFIYGSASSQKVEELKRSSENHNQNSGGNSGNSGNSESQGSSYESNDYSGSYGEIDPAACADACSGLFNILSLIEFNDNSSRKGSYNEQARDTQATSYPSSNQSKNNSPDIEDTRKKIPFEKVTFSVRGSFYPAAYHIWVPEISGTGGQISYSIRLLSIAEQRIDKVDHYSTFDVQPFQLNFVNKQNVLFKIGIGAMAETFSNNIYFEFTSNLKFRMGSKFDMGLEGRVATDNGIVRQEASVQLNYALWQKNNKQFLVGFNGMMSEYYEAVDLNAFSFSTGFRF